MKILTNKQIALLLPVTLLIHQLEEYFGGFPSWYSNLLNADLSNEDFLLINGVGLFIITALSISYFFTRSNLVLVALGTLVLLNGGIHLLLTIFMLSYSPGTLSGVILFLPLGAIIFKRSYPQLSAEERLIAIAIGIFILVAASTTAMRI